jgi:hypothetical protein
MAREIVTSENKAEYDAKKLGIKTNNYLPQSESLSIPEIPSSEQMKTHSRMENVMLNSIKGTQPKMDWDKFNAGKHPEELIKGYGKFPVAVKKENGEYLIYDGHHRAVLEKKSGKKHMKMHVIDAKSYDPKNAGMKPAKDKVSTDDLMKELTQQ